MSEASEITLDAAELGPECSDHVLRLLGSWSVLSDLSFSDLLLVTPQAAPPVSPQVAPQSGGENGATTEKVELEVIGQVRPATSATLVRSDLLGDRLRPSEWPAITQALTSGQIEWGLASLSAFNPPPAAPHSASETGELPIVTSELALVTSEVPLVTSEVPVVTGEVPVIAEEARLECVPVRCGDTVAAVLVRVSTIEQKRRSGRLERTYNQLYQRIAAMVAAGTYPFAGEEMPTEDAPRVGDGLVVVDTTGTIRYASPNAMSALHRMGVDASVDGRTLSELGIEEGAVLRALETGRPVIEEVERRPDVIVLVQCIPLLDGRPDGDGNLDGKGVTGGMVLLRDVTDLRRLDRLLLTKDAAIREVHHRVKNNLQTISSLLRLQARRLEPGEAQQALREAERRVRSIAVVHEILSRDPGEEVPFSEIVEALVRMAEDSVIGPGSIDIRVTGDLGEVNAVVATPLAVVMAELLQNALEHGFPGGENEIWKDAVSSGENVTVGHVDLALRNDGSCLMVQVRDDGVGLPEGFDIEGTNSLGLSIVRDLVITQLGGTIRMGRATDDYARPGAVVDITVLCDPGTPKHAW